MFTKQLLWKDAASIRSLVIAAVAGTLVMNLVVLVFHFLDSSSPSTAFTSIWVLMPNLVALGAPALLVGGEEESGTLSWLRTLPVRWSEIVDSKFVVALGGVGITWLAASLMYVMMLPSVSNTTSMTRELSEVSGVLHLMFFSVLLLITGFSTAYLFRSPIAALITLIPIIIVLNLVALETGDWLSRDDNGISQLHRHATIVKLVAAGLAALSVLWGVQRLLGRRRLTSIDGKKRFKASGEPSTVRPYRPPARVGLGHPSITKALLWQSHRQVFYPCVALVVVASVSVYLFSLNLQVNRHGNAQNQALAVVGAFAPLIVAIAASWIGGLTFYSDNVRQRCIFFSDRGVSPTRVWWTRQLIPVISIAVLIVVSAGCLSVVAADRRGDEIDWLFPVMIVVSFAFGQVISQWMKRPVLVFFGAPSFALISSIPLLMVLSLYIEYEWAPMLMAPVLLLATWWLTDRWLKGRVDAGYATRVVAFTLLALLMPVLAIGVDRLRTTPPELTAWRTEMLAKTGPAIDAFQGNPRLAWSQTNTRLQPRMGVVLFEEIDSVDEHLEMLEQELTAESLGDYVAFDDAAEYLAALHGGAKTVEGRALFDSASPQEQLELQHAAIAVFLKWATVIREGVLDGTESPLETQRIAEPSERHAVDALYALAAQSGPNPELLALYEQIPSERLRLESTRTSLITQWRSFDRTPWFRIADDMTIYGKNFGLDPVAYRVDWIPFEQLRGQRYIDLATKRTLEVLEVGFPVYGSETERELVKLWNEGFNPVERYQHQVTHFQVPNNSTSLVIGLLRETLGMEAK